MGSIRATELEIKSTSADRRGRHTMDSSCASAHGSICVAGASNFFSPHTLESLVPSSGEGEPGHRVTTFASVLSTLSHLGFVACGSGGSWGLASLGSQAAQRSARALPFANSY